MCVTEVKEKGAVEVAPGGAPARPQSRWRWVWRGLFVGFMLAVIVLGVMYRNWAWDFTSVARYRFDINRNYNFGVIALDKGYLGLYEDQVRDDPPYELKIDYPPLRLATFEAWAKWTRWTHPGVKQWQADYSFNWFLIQYNTVLGLLSSVAAFLIVRHWLRECARSTLAPDRRIDEWTGVFRATIAFVLLCFDPGVAIIGHGWPSPNLWVIPLYLWTVLLCLCERWFLAGIVLAIGVMMQGQQLLAAPVFVLWPIMAGRPMRALRGVAGFALAFGLIISGWMLTLRPDIWRPERVMNWPAIAWVGASVSLLAVVGLRTAVQGRKAWWFALPAAGAMFVLTWPGVRMGVWPGVLATTVAAGLVWVFWTRTWAIRGYVLALVGGASLLLCMVFWGAGTAWWKIGFMYGTERFQNVGGGTMVNNLPTILAPIFGWGNVHQVAWQIPAGWLMGMSAGPVSLEVRHVLLAMFALGMLLATYAMAKHWRRRDPSLLVALALPWVLFYTILPQMSPRYAVFVAGVGVICVGRSLMLIPAIWLFTFLTVEQTALCMCMGNGIPYGTDHPLFNGAARHFYQTVNPGLSWAVVVVAATLLMIALTPTPRRSGDPITSHAV